MFLVYSGFYKKIEYETFVFSGGEVHVKITSPKSSAVSTVHIRAQLHSANAILELELLVDALRRHYNNPKIELVAPYFPYARQDRQCDEGEALSVKIAARHINNLDLNRVVIWDAHSDVTPALLNNVVNVPPNEFVASACHLAATDVVLVAPDAGAIKKVSSVAKYISKPYIRADKLRDSHTGAIAGTVAYTEHIDDKSFLIVDDICDGGKTFTELARVLKPLTNGKVLLYVTHGIFAKGLDVFDGLIDQVYSPNPFDSELKHPLFTKI